jgi:type II secretory pathway component PulF
MNKFQYQGFDSSGGRVSGVIEAADQHVAMAMLKSRGLLVQTLTPVLPKSAAFQWRRATLTLTDIEYLTSELSVLLDAGLKIDKGVELLLRSNQKPVVAELLEKINGDLRRGKQMSEALKATGQFDELYINLIRIGEATGQLAAMFSKLALDLSFRRELQQKVIQALTYPMVVLFVCVSSILFIFNFVVPNMENMFAGQTDLPVYTQMLLGSSAWFRDYQWFLAAGLLALGVLAKPALTRPEVMRFVQTWQLKVPVLKNAVTLLERIRFNSGLSMMLSAGVAIDQALTLSAANVKNLLIRNELDIAIQKIKRGEQMSQVLRQSCLYPDFFASLLAVGEESGELGRVFAEITKRSQRDFSQWVTRFTSLLEPLMILVMGALVGGVVVIMMLSITTSSNIG